MLLADFKVSNKMKFNKLSDMLKRRYGITISEDASVKNLTSLREMLERDVAAYKLDGATLKTSTGMSEKSLTLECVSALLLEFMDGGTDFVRTAEYENLIAEMSTFIESSVRLGDSIDVAVDTAMRMYRSGKFRYPDDIVRLESSQAANAALGSNPMAPDMGAEPDMGMEPAMEPAMEPDMGMGADMGADMAMEPAMEPDMGVVEPEMAVVEPDIMEPEVLEPNIMGTTQDLDIPDDEMADGEFQMVEDLWSNFVQ